MTYKEKTRELHNLCWAVEGAKHDLKTAKKWGHPNEIESFKDRFEVMKQALLDEIIKVYYYGHVHPIDF